MQDLKRVIWLASYPKSGNTWIRSLLAHYFMPPGKAPDINNLRQFTTADVRQDFFDAANGGAFQGKGLEEWVRMRGPALRLIAASKQGHHFVKTHCQTIQLFGADLIPPEITAGAIYVMRNPFDLAPSFARHQSADIDTAIERMCLENTVMGTPTGIYDALGRWDDHIARWTEAPGLKRRIVRYEDLLKRPAKEMRGLLEDFLSVKVEPQKLARAVKATSFANMQKQEREKGFNERPEGMKAFFAKGQSGVWRTDLTPAQVGRIREAFLPTLETWYPELLDETAAFAKG
ncbi:sulfotransferase domain-containing protein [Roseovarius sp. LXJ103]|uniref:sulfotransferase domain-containing protein n=1 Tax=Roseovarius carneus TaxID=2853164 RepID=UPI000D61FF8C|nr:sulfotransferase domain-containing protein [Roseovarius carneus]MBZ8118815.1 sulfotransferase domain-containing protein [Roseovarius carneus]PWE35516.1 aryl sulfotransferase [Pelagicola sp. LXJ1103]